MGKCWWTMMNHQFLGLFSKHQAWQDELQQLHRSNSEKIKELWQRQDKKSEVLPEGDSCSVSWGVSQISQFSHGGSGTGAFHGPRMSNFGVPKFLTHAHFKCKGWSEAEGFWTLYIWDDDRESCERAALFNSFLETINIPSGNLT